MKIGTKKEDVYISGYFGSISNKLDDSIKEKCQTGTEDIICSYHYSGKIFKNIMILDNNTEIALSKETFNERENKEDGAIKITPIVPTVEINNTKITVGTNYDISNIKCIDNGSGCNFVKIQPNNTNELLVGKHKLKVIVIDDNGITYQYTTDLEVIE